MKLKKVMATAMVATMAVGMTACGSSDSKETTKAKSEEATTSAEPKDVTLTVWGPQEDQAKVKGYDEGILKAMCDKFNEEHPEWNITFKYGVCSEGDAKDVVTKDLNAAGDVYMFANDQIPTLVNAGALAKLGPTTEEAIKASNPQSMVDSVTFNDGIYGVPFTSNTWFMYYDKSKFSEDEVKSLDTMMAKDLGDGVTNVAFPLTNSWYVEAFYYAAGGSLFGPNGNDAAAGCDWDNEAGVEATKYMVNLKANNKFAVDEKGENKAKFKTGKLGAYFSGSWDAAEIKEALRKNFACAQLPTAKINGTDGQMKSFAGSKCIGVNPNTKNPEVAVALAQYLGSTECQKIRFETRGIIPTDSSVDVGSDAVAKAQNDAVANSSVVQPMLDEMGSYWTPVETMGKEIHQGDVTEANAKAKTEAMVKGILAK